MKSTPRVKLYPMTSATFLSRSVTTSFFSSITTKKSLLTLAASCNASMNSLTVFSVSKPNLEPKSVAVRPVNSM